MYTSEGRMQFLCKHNDKTHLTEMLKAISVSYLRPYSWKWELVRSSTLMNGWCPFWGTRCTNWSWRRRNVVPWRSCGRYHVLYNNLSNIILKNIFIKSLDIQNTLPAERGVRPPNHGETSRASGEAPTSIGDGGRRCLPPTDWLSRRGVSSHSHLPSSQSDLAGNNN